MNKCTIEKVALREEILELFHYHLFVLAFDSYYKE